MVASEFGKVGFAGFDLALVFSQLRTRCGLANLTAWAQQDVAWMCFGDSDDTAGAFGYELQNMKARTGTDGWRDLAKA